MPIIKGKGTYMTLIAGGAATAFYSGASDADVWVQSLGYGPKWKSESQNAFGYADPVEVDDTFDGISASFDLIETASKLALLALTGQAAGAKSFSPANYLKSYMMVNFKDYKTGVYLGAALLKGLKVTGADTQSAIDGLQTKKFDFEGTGVLEFANAIELRVETFTVATNEVAFVCNTATTDDLLMYDGSHYAPLVLVDGAEAAVVSSNPGALTFTEGYATQDLTITLGVTPGAGKKVQVVYLVDQS